VPEPITSPTNPQVKRLVRLRNRRERDASGVFTVEGFRELTRAVEAGVSIRTIYFCPELFLGDNERSLIERAARAGAEPVELGLAAFNKVSYRDRPEGLLGLAEQFPVGLDRLKPSQRPMLLVVESIEKPGNLGTMLRTADAAGLDGMIVCEPTTDPFNPNVVRASLGCLFTVPLAVASSPDTLDWLARHDIRTLATTPSAIVAYWDTDYRGAVAIAIGSEQYGLSDSWLNASGEKVRIPMSGSVDSLNAAMAAGIVLFEALRQRST